MILNREEQRERLKRETRFLEENSKTPSYILREKEARRAKRLRRIVLTALVSAFLAAGLCYYFNYNFLSYSSDGETTAGALDRTKVYSFADGAAVIGPDAVSYLEKGKTVWTQEFNMKNPVAAVKKEFFVVYDEDGYVLNLCDRTGVLSSIRLTRRIGGADISENGTAAVFTASDEAAYISYFDRFGSRIPVEIKSVLSATGYPVDFTVSPDGQKLSVIYYSVNGGSSISKLVLYDFEKGKKESNYIVGTCENPDDRENFLIETFFFDDSHLVCIGENSIEFLRYTEKRELVTAGSVQEAGLRSVVKGGEGLATVCEKEDGLYCTLYKKDGSTFSRFEVQDDYRHVLMNDRYIVFNDGSALSLYNYSGRRRYAGNLTDSVLSAAFSGEKSLTVNDGKVIRQITLK